MGIRVRRKHNLKLGQVVHVGTTEFVADVSAATGGDGAGPGPHDFYDAALGACRALPVMGYAMHKGIAVEDVEVDVERDAAQDRAGSYALATTLRVRGPLSAAQLGELLAVAEKCPVSKLMTSVKTTISARLERMV